MRAGLRVGDSVVEAGGQLVLFMEQEQVERLLQEDRLQIALTVERWSVCVKCNYILIVPQMDPSVKLYNHGEGPK